MGSTSSWFGSKGLVHSLNFCIAYDLHIFRGIKFMDSQK